MLIVIDSLNIKKCFTTDEDGLLQNIIEICDVICLTKRILGQYRLRGYYFDSLLPGLEQLRNRQPTKIVEPKLGPRHEIRGIPAAHRAFIEQAGRIKAAYFITENPIWTNARRNVEEQCGLKIRSPREYIRERVRQI